MMTLGNMRENGVRTLAITLLLCCFITSASAQSYKLCAGYFWAMQQCVIPQFREAYGNAFLKLARATATQDGKPAPLTTDEAVQQLSTDLRMWLSTIGARCENATTQRDMYQKVCTEILREK